MVCNLQTDAAVATMRASPQTKQKDERVSRFTFRSIARAGVDPASRNSLLPKSAPTDVVAEAVAAAVTTTAASNWTLVGLFGVVAVVGTVTAASAGVAVVVVTSASSSASTSSAPSVSQAPPPPPLASLLVCDLLPVYSSTNTVCGSVSSGVAGPLAAYAGDVLVGGGCSGSAQPLDLYSGIADQHTACGALGRYASTK